jgi:hypothetical protein
MVEAFKRTYKPLRGGLFFCNQTKEKLKHNQIEAHRRREISNFLNKLNKNGNGTKVKSKGEELKSAVINLDYCTCPYDDCLYPYNVVFSEGKKRCYMCNRLFIAEK